MSEPTWWKEFLMDQYKRCRLFSGWKTIYDLHDIEDRQFFDLLDRMRKRNALVMESPLVGE